MRFMVRTFNLKQLNTEGGDMLDMYHPWERKGA
jgi:hypothetical protein